MSGTSGNRNAVGPRTWRRRLGIIVLLALTPACTIGFNVGGSPSPQAGSASPSGPPSATPSATSSPEQPSAPTHCGEPLSGFRLSFDSQAGVSSADRADVERGAREARDYFRVQVPICDPGKIAVRVLERSKGNIAAETHVNDVPDFRIDVFAHGLAWERTSSASRSIIMLHEWYHVLQFSFLDCGPPECHFLRGHVPDWLIEGGAVYASLKAADDLHIAFYSITRANQIRIASTDHEPLSSLTQISSPGTNYSVAFAAVELLSSLGGRASLQRFWQLAGKTGGWKLAFSRVFHLTIDRFYGRFAAYRAAGFRR
jgi:hypothetical protein